MTRADAEWIAYFAGGLALELIRIRRHSPGVLTTTTRKLFRVHTRAGRAAWIIGWAAGTGWVLHHILEQQTHAAP